MPGGLAPDLVGYRVGPIAQPGDGLGERQGRAFGVVEAGRLAPGRHGEEALVRFACFPGVACARVDAGAAAIDEDRRNRCGCRPRAPPSVRPGRPRRSRWDRAIPAVTARMVYQRGTVLPSVTEIWDGHSCSCVA